MQFWPRKRARRIYPTINWRSIKSSDAKPLGFCCWKVGMTHAMLTDNNQKSISYGKVITKPVTVIESPSLFVLGIRFYEKTHNGLRTICDKLAENIPKDLSIDRKTSVTKKKPVCEKYDDITLIVATQPKKSGMKKLKPDVIEIGLGGELEKKKAYAESVLGKEINAKDIFKPGEFIDVSSVSKGHGFTGTVKRFGIRIQGRKDQQKHRTPGSIGSTVPRRVDWRVPMPGQHGFHTRTEYNKKVLSLNDDISKVNVKGGYLRYGFVKGSYVLLEGSVPGPSKRMLIMRKASRQRKKEIPVDLKYISLESKQGV
ncbi:MAG: 50S ribosomal protein L3 [Candidatus Aenigmarchaeota archaeon]|nr:50S ribosomal protein L3 [Candidatus Aenigmarchaeota archaeon]